MQADRESIGGKTGARGRELSVEHRLQQSGLLANYGGNAERRRQASESGHGPGFLAFLLGRIR